MKARFEATLRAYWLRRQAQADRQGLSGKKDAGARGAVTGGGHLDPLVELISEIFLDAGVPRTCIKTGKGIELPGFFRPSKKWDILVIREGFLAAAIELKSQAGPSFGNNYNNRIEEAIGSATDVWTAFREGQLGEQQPWLGYFLLLEDSPASTKPVRVTSPHFPADPVFEGASYKERYEIFCRRLSRERLYNAVSFATAPRDATGPIVEPAPDLSFDTFAAAIKARADFVMSL